MADNKNDDSRIANLYNALLAKKYSEVIRLCRAHPEDVLQKISIYNDTVLHMAAHSKQKDLLLDLLKILPADGGRRLSDIKNKDGNTILHEVATSYAMKDGAEELLNRDPKLLTTGNDLGEKPIFCAARYGEIEMFEFLAVEMKLTDLPEEEIKAHLQRDDGTTVLHISISAECFGLARLLAERYPYLIKERDRNSMTALQSLACNPSVFILPNSREGQFMEDIMDSQQKTKSKRKNEWLVDFFVNGENKESDEENEKSGLIQMLRDAILLMSGLIEGLINFGLFSFAAYKIFVERCTLEELVILLVKEDTSWDATPKVTSLDTSSQEMEGQNSHESLTNNYKKSEESALFLATMSNIKEIVKAILNYQPEALNHTNKEGMNVLHVAILYRHIDIFDVVVKNEVFSTRLLSTTDKKGNSVLHMVSQKRKSQASEKMQNPAVQLRDELLLFEKVKSASKMLVGDALNNDNRTAAELFAAANEQLHKDAKEWLMRTTENCTILSVFIATVAFAAAYTVPGGPNQDTGIPLLRSRPFFLAFILADVISLTLALTSVGIFFSILTSSFPLRDFKTYLFKKLKQGVISLLVSVSMMAVAFGATIAMTMTENRKNVVWDLVAFLPVPVFFLSCSPLRSLIMGPCRELFKIFAVSFLSVIYLACFLLFTLCLFCVYLPFVIIRELLERLLLIMEKARDIICGNKLQSVDMKSPKATAPILTEV